MEYRGQAQPMVYQPTRRDPRTLQTQPETYLPRQLPIRAPTNESSHSAPINDKHVSYQEPSYNPDGKRISLSSPLSGKELLEQRGKEATAWQRRRSSQGQEQQSYDEATSPAELPAAPDVPRAGPPVSYRRPYVDTVPPAARYGPSRSFSARARALQQGTYSPSLDGPDDFSASPEPPEVARPHPRSVSDSSTLSYAQIRPTIPASYSSSAGKPGLPINHSSSSSSRPNGTAASPLSRSNTRKEPNSTTGSQNWASDRSPLQKLEVKLSDISKEEKRARVQEAEQRLKDSKAGGGNHRPSEVVTSSSEQPPSRRVSRDMSTGPGKPMLDGFRDTEEGPLRRDVDTANKRKVNIVDQATVPARGSSKYGARQSPESPQTYNEGGTIRLNNAQDKLESQYRQRLHTPKSVSASEPYHKNTERGAQVQDLHYEAFVPEQSAWVEGRVPAHRGTYLDSRAPARTGTISGHGLPVMIGRNGTRKVSKEQPAVQDTKQSYGEKMEPSDMETLHIGAPNSIPNEAMQTPREQILRFEQAQTVTTQGPRQTAASGNGGNPRVEGRSHEKHHLSNLLHRGQPGVSKPLETHPVAPRSLDEWRGAKTARLTALDFLMESQDAASKQAWWERKSHSQRGAHKVQQSSDRDGTFGDENGMRTLEFLRQ